MKGFSDFFRLLMIYDFFAACPISVWKLNESKLKSSMANIMYDRAFFFVDVILLINSLQNIRCWKFSVIEFNSRSLNCNWYRRKWVMIMELIPCLQFMLHAWTRGSSLPFQGDQLLLIHGMILRLVTKWVKFNAIQNSFWFTNFNVPCVFLCRAWSTWNF